MFYNGDLQAGIQKALVESKLVACFCTDDGDEGKLWESDFLQETKLKNAISSQTVLLRLQAGSQELGYLAAIFPIPKFPTLVLIRNGELKEYIAAGVSRDDFQRRVSVVMEDTTSIVPPSQPLPTPSVVPNAGLPENSRNRHVIDAPAEPAEAVSPSDVSEIPQAIALAATQARVVQNTAPADDRQQAVGELAGQDQPQNVEETVSTRPADEGYVLMRKKRQQDMKDERARVLKRVEDDKVERKQREAQRKAEATTAQAPVSSPEVTRPSSSKQCALQIRLFDGSTIRERFPSTGNLRKDVRTWIDDHTKIDSPYSFKQVLAPLSNRNIEITQEDQSLYSLGLTPSATLILIPMQGYTTAYEQKHPTSSLLRSGTALYNWFFSLFAVITAALGIFLGGTAVPDGTQQRPHEVGGPRAGRSVSPARNLRDLRDQGDGVDPPQFYNGNTLSFESRKDDDEKKDE